MKYFVILALSLFGITALFGNHPVKFEMQLLAVDANEGVAVADYDKDGKLDENVKIPLPVEGLLNPELAHRFDDFAPSPWTALPTGKYVLCRIGIHVFSA